MRDGDVRRKARTWCGRNEERNIGQKEKDKKGGQETKE